MGAVEEEATIEVTIHIVISKSSSNIVLTRCWGL